MSNIVQFMKKDAVVEKFNQLLGKQKSTQFLSSILQIIHSNAYLKNAEPESVYASAVMAATLDLPINNNLGFAYIVPYKPKNGPPQAQFQLGYKGFIQLAQRSGQFKTIGVEVIYEGMMQSYNPINGAEVVWDSPTSNKVLGYLAYFKLLNGFEKTIYKTTEQVQAHAKKFSQSYGKSFGPWKDHFDAMAQKTVLKELLSKYAPLSVEMQQAVQSDQAVITEEGEFNYVDNDDSAQNSALAEAIEVEQVDSEEPLQATDQQLNFITEYLHVLDPEMQENVKMMLGDGLEMELAEQIINDIKAQQKKVTK